MAYKQSNFGKITPFEPPCRKTIYHTLEDAQDMIRYMKENRASAKEINAYKCDVCGFWHLTSKIKKI
jgi:hypothetical protein